MMIQKRKFDDLRTQWLGNTREDPKIVLDIFAKPQKVGCFFYECWIDLAASSWLTSRLKRNVQIYLGRYTSKLCDTVQIQRSASHVVVELPLNLKIISGMIRLHSIGSIQAFPGAREAVHGSTGEASPRIWRININWANYFLNIEYKHWININQGNYFSNIE